MIIFNNLLDETPRRLTLDQSLTKFQSTQHLPQLWTLLQINRTSRAVALLKYKLLFEGKCPFRPENHYMYFNTNVDTLCILDWSILRSYWRWACDYDSASIKHVECESNDYMSVLDLFGELETLKVHLPIEFTNFGRTYPELEAKMRELKDDIEQWNEEWHPDGCRPEVEVILTAKRLKAYSPRVPESMIPSDSEYV
ncbi:hypothetical protein OCU04_003960 [Sclerotinia nivalis]|uniref:Uncharacterized protein n=1 Tax=Sclerotinia nivalis TaxID=352851 RepID=A0A9X0DN92_9HELO|nr:hypothetical protein OCU04_003960 [Sclerotinia nivalis]